MRDLLSNELQDGPQRHDRNRSEKLQRIHTILDGLLRGGAQVWQQLLAALHCCNLLRSTTGHVPRGSFPLAPRLMLLDEAFAGINDAAKAHCMGLIREFDLDFVITSEREWACYAELPGVAMEPSPGDSMPSTTRPPLKEHQNSDRCSPERPYVRLGTKG
jgi:hypothetical protein